MSLASLPSRKMSPTRRVTGVWLPTYQRRTSLSFAGVPLVFLRSLTAMRTSFLPGLRTNGAAQQISLGRFLDRGRLFRSTVLFDLGRDLCLAVVDLFGSLARRRRAAVRPQIGSGAIRGWLGGADGGAVRAQTVVVPGRIDE